MDKKKIGWGILSLLIAFLSIWAIISQSKNFSVQLLTLMLKQMNKFWLAMAFVCTFGFIWFEGYAIVRITKHLGYSQSHRQGILYSAADVYFSAITPSASGGQPASAYFMMMNGIRGPVVTTTLLLNLIMYNLALLAIGLPSLIFDRHIFIQFSLISKLLIGVGCIVLLILAMLFYLLLFKAELLYGICNAFLKFLERIHLLHHGEKRREKLNRTMHDYQLCAKTIGRSPRMLLGIFTLNVLQRLSQLAVSFMVFLAMGRSPGDSFSAMIVQCFVALGSNSVPIPGGMGVADYIMLDGLKYLAGDTDNVNLELLCRGITFYGCVIIGGLIVLTAYFYKKNKNKKKETL